MKGGWEEWEGAGGVSVSNSVKEIGSDDRKAMMVEEQRVD